MLKELSANQPNEAYLLDKFQVRNESNDGTTFPKAHLMG